MRGQVEPEASEIEHLAVPGPGRRSGAGAPQDRLDPGDDLGGRGGLDDVVIAEAQTAQLVGIRVTRGEEEDGHLGGLADPAADLESGCPGHHHVQQHAVHRLGGDHGQSPVSVAGGEYRAAVGLQVITQDLSDLQGVIDDKDRNRWRHRGDRGFLTGLMRTEYGYVINAPDYAALLEHPDMPAAQILTILHRQFQPDGHPVPDAQILAAMGLNSASQLTARKALGLLGVRPGSADAAGYREAARSSAPASPPRTDLFATAVYNRGAMTLQALRLRVGTPSSSASCVPMPSSTASATPPPPTSSPRRKRSAVRT